MEKKKLYMIGNSHIDPVWFWDWDEGMQEVKATFSSALDRMKEYPEMRFTATSSAFFEWLEITVPKLFEEIKKRVAEGRFELTGGWFIEPDCILPCGEAFVRQGLYGQRYFEEKFGQICKSGSNVDSFGHNPSLPQILKKSGMEEYIFMRPRLNTPLFQWESEDGSQINVLSLPSEYTTWFYESAREAAELAAAARDQAGLHSMACCYGVGNHGGGPTRKNIEAIQRLQEEFPEQDLVFGTFRQFFDSLTEEEKEALPVRKQFFDKINTGCYSMDGNLKRHNRRAEDRLKRADMLLVMEYCLTGRTNPLAGRMKELWKTLLFNQFHDTLGGTAVKEARDEAIYQLSHVCAESKKIWTLSIQNIVQAFDTQGRGFPLFLFNPDGMPYEGPVSAELNWFCKDGLILLDPAGKEIAYQRAYTAAKVRNYNLGGRRRIIFDAKILAAGFAVYRTVPGSPSLACDIRTSPEFSLEKNVRKDREDHPYLLENKYIRAAFNKEGYLESLYDKENDYEALTGALSFPIKIDERDTWGSRQERRFEDSGETLLFQQIETVEDGDLRKVVRAVYAKGGSRMIQEYILYHNAREVEIVNRLYWDQEWRMLQMELPLQVSEAKVYAECAYATVRHFDTDGEERSMHRFLDVTESGQAGLCTANDGKYTYTLLGNVLRFSLARSAIYAQGNGRNWYNPEEGYEYADIGSQEFTFLLKPHGRAITQRERYRLAGQVVKPYLYLADHIHTGGLMGVVKDYSPFSLEAPGVELVYAKLAEDGDGIILRLLETEGKDKEGRLHAFGNTYPFHIGHYGIETIKIENETKEAKRVNLLEKQYKAETGYIKE